MYSQSPLFVGCILYTVYEHLSGLSSPPTARRLLPQLLTLRCHFSSVDNTNLWEGLEEKDDVTSTLEKGQRSVNSWGSNLLTVGGELRPDKCLYTVHRMQPTKHGDWEYIKEKNQQRIRRRQMRTKKNLQTSGRI